MWCYVLCCTAEKGGRGRKRRPKRDITEIESIIEAEGGGEVIRILTITLLLFNETYYVNTLCIYQYH